MFSFRLLLNYHCGRGFYAPTGVVVLGGGGNTSDFALTTWCATDKVAHNNQSTDFAELVDWRHKFFKL